MAEPEPGKTLGIEGFGAYAARSVHRSSPPYSSFRFLLRFLKEKKEGRLSPAVWSA